MNVEHQKREEKKKKKQKEQAKQQQQLFRCLPRQNFLWNDAGTNPVLHSQEKLPGVFTHS